MQQPPPPAADDDTLRDAMAAAQAAALPVVDLFTAVDALKRSGRERDGAALLEHWIAFNPDDPLLYAVLFNQSVALTRLGRRSAAINALRSALALNPDFAPLHINLGRLLEDAGALGAAVAQWSRLVDRLSAVSGEAVGHKLTVLEQMGRVLEEADQDAAAEDAFLSSLLLRPDQPEIAQHWASVRMRQCKWPAIQPPEGMGRRDILKHVSPLSLANLCDDPMFQLAAADRYCRTSVGLAAPVARPPRAPGRKLRVGYLSSDLRQHAVGFAIVDVLECHDRGAVEVFAYYCGVDRTDDTMARARAAVDRWADIAGLDDDAAAALIAGDGVDILVDLNGYTKSARTAVFARRPAPVAVNWFGFPGTLGSPYHHYIVADSVTVPVGSEVFYSEKVVRLPCYQPNDRHRRVASERPSRQDEGLPEEAVVFCCLNGMQKITEGVFFRWMSILSRVPGSVLWLLGGTADTDGRLRQRAAACGVAPERLVFAGKRPNPEHLARYALADLFLDTFPYNAHTTAADALWMGVPILTLPGRSFASRVCASVVTAAGLPELVCDTPDNYAAMAVALGQDRAALAGLKARLLAGRDGSLLFDTPLLVRALEGLFRDMWEDHAAGRLPRPRLDGLDRYHEVGLDLDHDDAEPSPEGAYRARWHAGLARWDAAYPMEPDGRLWTGRQPP